MGNYTNIEWTDRVWNPVRGCSLVSAGCTHCYAMRQAHRFSGQGQPYEGLTELGPQGPRWTGQIRLVPALLEAPLHWRKPSRIFVNSMSDLFHEEVPAPFIVECCEVMAACPQHTFLILTKRPERVESVLYGEAGHWYLGGGDWLPNVWMGFSAETQATYHARWQCFGTWAYAMNLWTSLEPLVSAIDLVLPAQHPDGPKVSWVVVGGESGPNARPFNVEWARDTIRQCRAAGVKVFCKQLGSVWARTNGAQDSKGSKWEDWPNDLKVREFPNVQQVPS